MEISNETNQNSNLIKLEIQMITATWVIANFEIERTFFGALQNLLTLQMTLANHFKSDS